MKSSNARVAPAVVALAALASFAAACASKSGGSSAPSPSSDVAASAVDGNSTESSSEAMASTFIGSGSGGLSVNSVEHLNPVGSSDLTTLDIVQNPGGGFYHPAGCLTANSDAATKTVTYTFNGCSGPLGLVSLTGAVKIVWSSTGPTNLTLNYSASDFQISKATISSWQATAVITASGEQRDMTWNAVLSGTTGGGRQFDRTNQKDMKWTVGQPCLAVSGKSDGTITGKHLVTTISNFQQCADACPAANSEINVDDVDSNKSIDVKFLGGPNAQFTAADGTITDLPLRCGQ